MAEIRLQRLLAALQFADSALPIGRYAHAGGLEEMVRQEGPLAPETLGEMIDAAVLSGVGPSDGVAVAQAHDAVRSGDLDRLKLVDACLLRRKLTEAARQASTRCGRQLASFAPELAGGGVLVAFCEEIRKGNTAGNLAVVAGAAMATADIRRDESVLIEIRGAAGMMVSAAVRLGVLAATRAQLLLREREAAILRATESALAAELDSMGSAAFELEIAVMRQRYSDARLFAT